jgi:hypothetical protein
MTPQRRQEFAAIPIGGSIEEFDKLEVSNSLLPIPLPEYSGNAILPRLSARTTSMVFDVILTVTAYTKQ